MWKPSVETVLRCISTFSGLKMIKGQQNQNTPLYYKMKSWQKKQTITFAHPLIHKIIPVGQEENLFCSPFRRRKKRRPVEQEQGLTRYYLPLTFYSFHQLLKLSSIFLLALDILCVILKLNHFGKFSFRWVVKFR